MAPQIAELGSNAVSRSRNGRAKTRATEILPASGFCLMPSRVSATPSSSPVTRELRPSAAPTSFSRSEPSLAPLLGGLFGVEVVAAGRDQLPPFDLHCPLPEPAAFAWDDGGDDPGRNSLHRRAGRSDRRMGTTPAGRRVAYRSRLVGPPSQHSRSRALHPVRTPGAAPLCSRHKLRQPAERPPHR